MGWRCGRRPISFLGVIAQLKSTSTIRRGRGRPRHCFRCTLQSGVLPNDASDALLCVGTLLLTGVAGFAFCNVSGRFASGYSARQNAVIAARLAANEPRRPYLPAAPGGVLSSSVLVLLVGWRLNCTAVPNPHLLFTTALVACAISTSLWLMLASSVSDAAEQERHARIEAFIDDPEAPVRAPVPGLESMPAWFVLWNRVNVSVFCLAMGWLGVLMLRLASASAS